MTQLRASCFPGTLTKLSSTETSVTVQENTVTSKRKGTITYTQTESRKIICTAVEQREVVVSYRDILTNLQEIFESTGNTINTSRGTVCSIKETLRNGRIVSSTDINWGFSKTPDSGSFYKSAEICLYNQNGVIVGSFRFLEKKSSEYEVTFNLENRDYESTGEVYILNDSGKYSKILLSFTH